MDSYLFIDEFASIDNHSTPGYEENYLLAVDEIPFFENLEIFDSETTMNDGLYLFSDESPRESLKSFNNKVSLSNQRKSSLKSVPSSLKNNEELPVSSKLRSLSQRKESVRSSLMNKNNEELPVSSKLKSLSQRKESNHASLMNKNNEELRSLNQRLESVRSSLMNKNNEELPVSSKLRPLSQKMEPGVSSLRLIENNNDNLPFDGEHVSSETQNIVKTQSSVPVRTYKSTKDYLLNSQQTKMNKKNDQSRDYLSQLKSRLDRIRKYTDDSSDNSSDNNSDNGFNEIKNNSLKKSKRIGHVSPLDFQNYMLKVMNEMPENYFVEEEPVEDDDFDQI